MIINIDEKYSVETDSFGNYSLARTNIVQNGENAGREYKTYCGHYSSLRGAVKGYVRERFNDCPDDMEISLADAVKRLEAIEDDAIARLGL